MITKSERPSDDHDSFRQLAAWAISNGLTVNECDELKAHLQTCEACRKTYCEFLILTREGVPLLAADYDNHEEQGSWDDALVRERIFDRIRAEHQQVGSERAERLGFALWVNPALRILSNISPLAQAALIVCLIGAVGFVAHRLGSRTQGVTKQSQTSAEDRFRNQVTEKEQMVSKLRELLDHQRQSILRLEQQRSLKEQEVTNLRASLLKLEHLVNQLSTSNSPSDEELKSFAQQRVTLNDQLLEAEQSYSNVEAQLASLRSERDVVLVKNALLESENKELSAALNDQERRFRDDEQYLASDRDIRDLIGARNLYIADVFDVDSRSRTRKPFGRVFYTQGRSLIFYAFDLDRQPGLHKDANAFQAWGRRESAQGKPLNLGILFMDNESNRRWVLRFDDPRQLAEIDAVFVTIEPRGGSPKPTGKPFLYAALRKEANHP